MRKHEYAKMDCACPHRVTNFKCAHCGGMEHASPDKIRRLSVTAALCASSDAPLVTPAEKFSGFSGGTFDCLAEDYKEHFKKETSK